ncbi:uncharacterized protein J8A68_003544 [[Candida] subhashii]|uniref:Zn(2)-C6 fungal-type domain-containing protein n=1 Tax=[Candida] subhashii TaxID=561895 RepID=A0A8J5Q8R6_9ASCO|nr:uncharacterized protein J8A68_003544 [[Candida] subhashii]KAG7662954.1 hypothetical protein J8A68_003544 [[Candida] subhashii]
MEDSRESSFINQSSSSASTSPPTEIPIPHLSGNFNIKHSNSDYCGAGGGIGNKPKRQRRSYSCGPCKLLKIKCDLQIPCSSCKKFKRISRCLLQPPQPPSQEELNKIKQRKTRTNIKKLKLTGTTIGSPNVSTSSSTVNNEIVTAYNSNLESIPSLINRMSTVSKSSHHHIHNVAKKKKKNLSISHPSGHLRLQPEPIDMKSKPPIAFITSQFGQNITSSPSQLHQQQQLQEQYPYANDNLLDRLYYQDTFRMYELTMVDIRRIKRLLPNNFNIFEQLFEIYKSSLNVIIHDLQNLSEIKQQSKLIYYRILNINDELNLASSISFNMIELRQLSLMFLILVNGFYLKEFDDLKNFLIEPTIFKPKEDIINDWIKISKFIKLKILSYDTLTDLIYLIDWYLIIKNYYSYSNLIVDNYLEFNNLLNYIVLNNDFIELLEDPGKESTPESEEEHEEHEEPADIHPDDNESNDDEIDDIQYPNSKEFKLLAKYWIQIRLVEIEYTFFQFKGSLLVSNQLKNTLVPHERLLSVVYPNETRSLHVFSIKIWGLYYRQSKRYSTSIRDIIKNYLLLYSNVAEVLKDELNDYSQSIRRSISTNQEVVITDKDLELVIKNQQVGVLFIRWLAFIRIESKYFPSLRYFSYFTSMINLFNHFNIIDNNVQGKLLWILIDKYPIHYIKSFYQCLTYQGIFLIILTNSIGLNLNYKINLSRFYNIILNQFKLTLNKFLNFNHKVNHLRFFNLTNSLLIEFANILDNNNQSTTTTTTTTSIILKYENLSDLVYNLKSIIHPEQWELLMNFYFGSQDNFIRYIEKVWDLFEFLKLSTVNQANNTQQILITQNLKFDDASIESLIGNLTGFVFDNEVVNEYMKTCVDPYISKD